MLIPLTHKPKLLAMAQTLQAAQVGTGPLPMVRVPRAQHGAQLLEARRRPADLVMVTRAQPAFGSTFEPASTPQLKRSEQNEERTTSAAGAGHIGDAENVPGTTSSIESPELLKGILETDDQRPVAEAIRPKTVRQVFSLACSRLLPTIATGKLSRQRGWKSVECRVII